MRQLSPFTNLLMAVAAAAGLVASLRLPWFGPAGAGPTDDADRMEAIGVHVLRWFDTAGTTTFSGAASLGWGEQALVAIAIAAAALAAATLVPFLRETIVSQALRWLPLVAPVVVLVQVLSHPLADTEVRWGAFVAVAVAAFLASAAFHGAGARRPKAPPAPYAPPVRPGSLAPPAER